MTDDRLARLEAEVAALRARVAALEGLPAPQAASQAASQAAPQAAPAQPAVAAAAAPAAEVAAAGVPAATAPAVDWERLIGGRWSLWVGALAIFLSAAFFLAYAWQSLGSIARVGLGFALGAAFLGVAAFVRRRAEPWFAEGLAGAGLGLFYLSTWAAHGNYGLVGAGPAFGLLLAITAFGTFLALRYDAKSQMALATGGGFLTPFVLGDAVVPGLLTGLYPLVLDGGLLAISFHKRWPGLAWACLAGSIALAWLLYVPADPWQGFALLTVGFGFFATAAVGHSLRRRERTLPHDVLLLFAAAFYYAPMAFWLIEDRLGGARALFPLALAAAFFGVGRLVRRHVPGNGDFRRAADALAVLFVTLTLPAQLDHSWLVVGWAVEAGLLAGFALRHDDPVFRQAGRAVGFAAALAAIRALDGAAPEWKVPVLNAHALPLAAATASAAAVAAYARRLGRAVGPGAAVGLALGGLAWSWTDATLAVGDGGILAGLPPHAADRLAAGLAALGAAAMLRLGRGEPGGGAGASWLRAMGLFVGLTAVLMLLWPDPAGAKGALDTGRPFATAAVLAGGMLMVRSLAGAPERLRAAVALATVGVAVWGVSVEAYAGVRGLGWADWERPAQLAVSLAWIGSGLACLLGGIRGGSRRGSQSGIRLFRLAGLGLLGASVVKVFLFDVSSLDTPYRIAAFAGLGMALIGISWLYGRYGVGERAPAAAPADASAEPPTPPAAG